MLGDRHLRAALLAGVGCAGCGLYYGGSDGPAVEVPDTSDVPPDGAAHSDGPTPDAGSPPFVPSHTNATFDVGATDLVDPTAIDTSNLQLSLGGPQADPPPGIGFTDVGGIAILRVGAWSQHVVVKVTGTRPLLVLAARDVAAAARA